MKHPITTVAPKRQFIRPVSIMKPTAATAITATAVATLPISVPCSQPRAATIGPEPRGSEAVVCACAVIGAIMARANRRERIGFIVVSYFRG